MVKGVLPKSMSGRWAVGLTASFVILMVFKVLLPLPLPTPLIALLGLAGFVFAVYAAIKADRAVLVFVSLAIGLIIVLWAAAELIYPH